MRKSRGQRSEGRSPGGKRRQKPALARELSWFDPKRHFFVLFTPAPSDAKGVSRAFISYAIERRDNESPPASFGLVVAYDQKAAQWHACGDVRFDERIGKRTDDDATFIPLGAQLNLRQVRSYWGGLWREYSISGEDTGSEDQPAFAAVNPDVWRDIYDLRHSSIFGREWSADKLGANMSYASLALRALILATWDDSADHVRDRAAKVLDDLIAHHDASMGTSVVSPLKTHLTSMSERRHTLAAIGMEEEWHEATPVPDIKDAPAMEWMPSEPAVPQTLDEAAEELGGDVNELRTWIESGEVACQDPAAALKGHLSEEDYYRLERRQIELDIRQLFKDPDDFLNTPLDRLGGKAPREMLGTSDQQFIRDIVWGRKAGAL